MPTKAKRTKQDAAPEPVLLLCPYCQQTTEANPTLQIGVPDHCPHCGREVLASNWIPQTPA